MISPKIYPQWH